MHPPTPSLVIDLPTVRRNLARLGDYAASHGLKLRPHTKTHKSIALAKLQLSLGGSTGLTVAKVGEAQVMAEATDDLLLAYPAVDEARCTALAKLAARCTLRVAIDSTFAADALSQAASREGTTIGILIDLDVGTHRTGVQSPAAALALAQHVDRAAGLRLDGLFFYPGFIASPPDQQKAALEAVDAMLRQTLDLWKAAGLEAPIVSGGSTPTAFQSHLIKCHTEVRPGTYIFYDMNGVRGGYASLDDCAARIHATVVSDAVPGQIVLDAGSKTLTMDRCGPAPDSGHGLIVEYPHAKITKLTEEHGQVDITACDRAPKLGERVTIIPNHICPCVNLQNQVWWTDNGSDPTPMPVDARGKVF
ncbi:MAG: alanine racemase [Phycisphaeraceae bacterium]